MLQSISTETLHALEIASIQIMLGLTMCIVGASIAEKKNRSKAGWFVIIIFTGIVGLIIIYSLDEVEVNTSSNRCFVPSQTLIVNTHYAQLQKNEHLYEDGIISEEKYKEEKKRIESEIAKEKDLKQQAMNKQVAAKTSDMYINEVLDDDSTSYDTKLAQLNALKREKKISKEEYKFAVKNIQ